MIVIIIIISMVLLTSQANAGSSNGQRLNGHGRGREMCWECGAGTLTRSHLQGIYEC